MICQRSGFTSLTQLVFFLVNTSYFKNGDNHIQNFHLGGISSDIRSEIVFYDSADASP